MNANPFQRHSAASPHPSDTSPDSCPACRSRSIVSAGKQPSATSYWRCADCGEIWNDARRQQARTGSGSWR